MAHRDIQIIHKLLVELQIITDLPDGFDEAAFLADERTARAVRMTLINTCKPVKHLSDGFNAAHPHIPWRAIAGMRNVTAHRHQPLKMADVYATHQPDIPTPAQSLQALA